MPAKIRRALRLTLPLCLMTAGTAAAAGLLVAEGGFGGALEIVEHSVHVTFNNGIVVTEVEQVFRNLEDRQVEALYTFPVPSGASLADFTMWIGGKEMVGEVVEKQRARGIYESYKRRFIDPGLLEQTNFKTFEMRIFPIAARAEQRVRIAYYQELDFDHDWATYVYPLRTRHATADARAHERFEFKLDVTSEVPITRLESPSHEGELLVVCHSDYEYQASLESAGADLNRDVVVAIKLERPKTGLDLVVTRERGEDGTFQLTLTAGDELDGAEREDLDSHLAGCPMCRSLSQEQARLDQHLGQAIRDVPVPPGLRERLLAAVAPVRRPRRWLRTASIGLGLATAASLGLVVWAWVYWQGPLKPTISPNRVQMGYLATLPRDADAVNAELRILGARLCAPEWADYSYLSNPPALAVLPGYTNEKKPDKYKVPLLVFSRSHGKEEVKMFILHNRAYRVEDLEPAAYDNYNVAVYQGRYFTYLMLYKGRGWEWIKRPDVEM